MNAVALNVSLAPRVRVAPKAAAKPARAVSPPSPRGAPATIFPTRAAIISYPENDCAPRFARDPGEPRVDRSHARN